jgi:hypothetical protein
MQGRNALDAGPTGPALPIHAIRHSHVQQTEESMIRFLNWFRSHRSTQPTSPRRRSVHLQIEQLHDRLLPSASSAISVLHATGYNQTTTEHDWYTIDQSTRHVVEFQETTRHNLPGGPGFVFSVSATVGPCGCAEAFALTNEALDGATPNGPLWLCDESGNWHVLGGDYYSISATRDGHVYAVSAAGDVNYLDANGNAIDLGAPKPGVNLTAAPAAGVNGGGLFGTGNNVFVIGKDQAIYVNGGSNSNAWRLVDNSTSFATLSAPAANTVFAVTGGGKLYQETEHLGFNGWYFTYSWSHQDISSGRTFAASSPISADLDASGNAEVYAIEAGTFNAYLYDQGSMTQKDSDVSDIAGAGGGYFYDTNPSANTDTAWQYDPNHPIHWTYLGTGLS